MKITFVGTSHGIAEKNRFRSCTVITVKGKHYLIDAGAPIYDLLQRYDFKFENVNGIFITHTHEDHTDGLIALYGAFNGFNQFNHIKINAYVPDTEHYEAIKKLYGFLEDKGRLTFNKYENGVIFDDGNVKVTAIPTKHIEGSHSFLVEAEGKKVGFSGDLHYDLIDYPQEFTSSDSKLDLVVMEAAHQSYDKQYVYDVLGKTNTKKMIINHIYEVKNPLQTMDEFAKKVSNKFDFSVSYDGLEIEL